MDVAVADRHWKRRSIGRALLLPLLLPLPLA